MTMTKLNIIPVLIFISAPVISISQTISTSKGGSSILYEGTGLSFDVSDESLKFNINNYSSSSSALIKQDNGLLYGSEVSVANSSKTGFLFQGGNYQATSKLGGTLGYYWSNRDERIEAYEKANAKLISLYKIRKKMSVAVDSLLIIGSVDDLDLFFVNDELKDFDNKAKQTYLKAYNEGIKKILSPDRDQPVLDYGKALSGYQKEITSDKKMDESKQKFLLLIVKKMKELIFDADASFAELEKQIKIHSKEAKAKVLGNYWKATLYTIGGINAEKFKHFTAVDTADFNKSFTKEFSRGSYFGVGFNWNFPFQGGIRFFGKNEGDKGAKHKPKTIYFLRNIIIGMRYTYSETSSFGLMDKQSYKLVQGYTNSSGQTLTATADIAAYSGDYTKLFENRLNFDLMKVFNLDSLSIVADLYIVNKKVNRLDLIPETTDAGISLSFFKPAGKFMGGFYVEVPDWDDNLEDIKETPNYRDRKNRMSFGIFATYTFGSLFNSTLFAPNE